MDDSDALSAAFDTSRIFSEALGVPPSAIRAQMEVVSGPWIARFTKEPKETLEIFKKMIEGYSGAGDYASPALQELSELELGLNTVLGTSVKLCRTLIEAGAFELSVSYVSKRLETYAPRVRQYWPAAGLRTQTDKTTFTWECLAGAHCKFEIAALRCPDVVKRQSFRAAALQLLDIIYECRAEFKNGSTRSVIDCDTRWKQLSFVSSILSLLDRTVFEGESHTIPRLNKHAVPVIVTLFSATTSALKSLSKSTLFSGPKMLTAQGGKEWQDTMHALLQLVPIMFQWTCDRSAYTSAEQWQELSMLSDQEIRDLAIALKTWLQACNLDNANRSFAPDLDEVRSLTGACEVLCSLVYTPGDSMTQRPDPPPVSRMPAGQLAFVALLCELDVDVQLVRFMSAVPIVAAKQSGIELEATLLSLRAVHLTLKRLLDLSLATKQHDQIVKIARCGLIRALSVEADILATFEDQKTLMMRRLGDNGGQMDRTYARYHCLVSPIATFSNTDISSDSSFPRGPMYSQLLETVQHIAQTDLKAINVALLSPPKSRSAVRDALASICRAHNVHLKTVRPDDTWLEKSATAHRRWRAIAVALQVDPKATTDDDQPPTVCASTSCPTPDETAPLLCARCKTARYCSQACQRADWKLHRAICAAPK